jgi:hypothetical protein
LLADPLTELLVKCALAKNGLHFLCKRSNSSEASPSAVFNALIFIWLFDFDQPVANLAAE